MAVIDGGPQAWSTCSERRKSGTTFKGIYQYPARSLLLVLAPCPRFLLFPLLQLQWESLQYSVLPTTAGVTQAQVDAVRVAGEHYNVNEAKANTMILLTLEQKDVMILLAYPRTTSKWAKIEADHMSISPI